MEFIAAVMVITAIRHRLSVWGGGWDCRLLLSRPPKLSRKLRYVSTLHIWLQSKSICNQ